MQSQRIHSQTEADAITDKFTQTEADAIVDTISR